MSRLDVINYLKLKKSAGVNELCRFARTSKTRLDNMVRDGVLEVRNVPHRLGGRYKINGKNYKRIYSLKNVIK